MHGLMQAIKLKQQQILSLKIRFSFARRTHIMKNYRKGAALGKYIIYSTK